MAFIRRKERDQRSLTAPAALAVAALSMVACDAYTLPVRRFSFVTQSACSSSSSSAALSYKYSHSSRLSMIFAPPGSGYATSDDEKSPFPDTYEPMMEFPGTMRPGRTPEDQPFHDLPIGDNDPDPVPWPHFQQIEWHHRWEPPHEHPIPMEEFIELQGRWATPELEAAMRAGARRDVRERREQAEDDKSSTLIMDDEEDDFDKDEPVALGDGMFGQLGSGADQSITAAAVAPPKEMETGTDVEEEMEDEDDGFDDFLLDLGLDADFDDILPPSSAKATSAAKDDDDDDDFLPVSLPSLSTKENKANNRLPNDDDDEDQGDIDLSLDLGLLDDEAGEEDDGADLDLTIDEDDDDAITAVARMEEDSISFDDDGDDEIEIDDEGVTMVPLEDFGDSDDLDEEDAFDDGGFDYDDADLDMDGGDNW